MTPTYHVPVMAQTATELLTAAPAGPLLDATAGGGGHLAALHAAAPERALVGVDQDPDALAASRARLGDAVTLVHGNFSDLGALVSDTLGAGPQLAGIICDLGVSSWQLDAPARGFAIKHPDAALDMRMDPTSDAPTARQLIDDLDAAELATVLGRYGEVKRPRHVAEALKAAAASGDLETTGQLARAVSKALNQRPVPGRVHPATRAFQALRIAVNDELRALDRFLDAAPDVLIDAGRLVVIAYHSLEDRRVKTAFRLGEDGPERPARLPPPSSWSATWTRLGRKPRAATPEEIAANPRSRSARLRAAARAPRASAAGGRA